VCCRCIPSAAQYFANSVAVNSPLRSVRSALNFAPDLPSACAYISLMAAATQSFEGIAATHMYLVKSSTMSRKYLLPRGVAGVIGPHRSACTSSGADERGTLLLSGMRSFSACRLGKPRTPCPPARSMVIHTPSPPELASGAPPC
jgi:hypothetical protein